jgi:hypothetical protein
MSLGAVVVLAGRRIDAAEAEAPRFPARNLATVEERISELLRESDARVLVCAAACGADILALEAAGRMDIRRRVVLPYGRELFRKTSVDDRPGEWGARYDRLLDEIAARGDLVVLGFDQGDNTTYLATNSAIIDEACKIADAQQHEILAVIVWDKESRGEDDVTAAFRSEAVNRGLRVTDVRTI